MIGLDVLAQAGALKASYPDIYACIDPLRLAQQRADPAINALDDFGSASCGGRGESYVIAQQSIGTRARGIRRLVEIIVQQSMAESDILVDLLGGDGLVRRVVSSLGVDQPVIVTCDASPFMVEAAWAKGIPALLQRAEAPLFRNESVGGVLLAYGSHHIAAANRSIVAREAFRILQQGGVFVLHDFLAGSPVHTWFSEVVDVYSTTGHGYAHFARNEVTHYFSIAGFTDVESTFIDDSFVVWGSAEELTQLELGRYLTHMYGLVELIKKYGTPGAYRKAFEFATKIFRYEGQDGECRAVTSAYDESRSMWSMTMPREALVGYGRKP